MEMNSYHNSIMLDEIIEALDVKTSKIYLDATIGGGGHSKAILEKGGNVIGIDRDIESIEYCKKNLIDYRDKLILIKDNFKNIDKILNDLKIKYIDGAVLDLGVSSHQIDCCNRGFSYMQDGKLDMRMDKDEKLTAYEIINKKSEKEIADILYKYADEKFSRIIAKNIIKFRKIQPIRTTKQLSEICIDSLPNNYKHGHPAKKTFQALRIYVNHELDYLAESITNIIKHLKKNSKICILSFHSIEDRIVKNTLKNLAKDCICPKYLPKCVCHHKSEIQICGKIKPSSNEIKQNKRSKSALLRIAKKLED